MYFNNLEQLMLMGGHGPYVWSAFAVTIAALVWLVLAPIINHRALLKDVARDLQREQARQASTRSKPDISEESI